MAETLEAVANRPWQQEENKLLTPSTMAQLAALTLPLVASSRVPITTFAQAVDASIAEQEWVADHAGGLAVKDRLGQAPRLLAEHLVRSEQPFDSDLVAAFIQQAPQQQVSLLRGTSAEYGRR